MHTAHRRAPRRGFGGYTAAGDGGGDVAQLVTIEGQRYVRRDPLGVLGLSFITIGIYWLYWYYKVNDEIRRYEKDDSVRPGIALLAITLGWFIIVPPFISMYNTSKHIVRMEERAGVAQVLSPALNVVLLLIVSIATGLYSQEHLNKVWDAAARRLPPAAPGSMPPPPA
jgi:Domain of unknown function (DUF4234)